ncbi:MAG: M12 family metallopeptidase [Dermatophilaceae bacterium]
MANMRSDRTQTRWLNGVVPFEIDPSIGAAGRTLIDGAQRTWQSLAPVRFVERQGENDYVAFQRKNDECFSAVGRHGGMQSIGCEFPLVPLAPPAGQLASAAQEGAQRDLLFVGTDGAVYVLWTVGPLTWSDAVRISDPGLAVPGSPIALARQGDHQLDAVFVAADGRVCVMWVIGGDVWQGPVGLTGPGTALPGSPVALEHQGPDQLDAVFVAPDGRVCVMWVIGGDVWQGPVGLTGTGAALAGTPVSLAHQGDHQLDAVFVAPDGRVCVMWVIGGDAWQGPVGLTDVGIAAPGTPVALDHQGNNQLDAVFVGADGRINVMWVIGGDPWQGPVGLTAPGVAAAGAHVSLAHQGGPNQLDAIFVGADGRINVMWVIGGDPWQGPVGLDGVVAAGTPACVVVHPGDTVEVMVAGNDSELYSLSVVGLGVWSGLSALGSGFGQATVTHECGHALGLFHEQQRPDRGAFVTYYAANVQAGEEHNFDVPPEARGLGPYDYGSIMHYGPGAFSAPGMGPTLQGPPGVFFGSAAAPSAEDARAMRYIYGQVTQPGAHVAAAPQTADQLTLCFADTFGALSVMWVVGGGIWEVAVPLTAPGVLVPGGSVSLTHQGPDQLDAVFVGVDGKINVMWAQGGGAWQGPVGLTDPGVAVPGSPVALDHQGPDQLDAVFVGVDGKINVMWAQGGGAWQGPVGVS